MNNLPKVVTQQHRGRASNPRLLGRKSDALPLSHRATCCVVMFFCRSQLLLSYCNIVSETTANWLSAKCFVSENSGYRLPAVSLKHDGTENELLHGRRDDKKHDRTDSNNILKAKICKLAPTRIYRYICL